MSSFKDYLASDLDTILNPDEFGELHDIDGRQLIVIPDNDQLTKRSQREYDGIYTGDLLYYVKAKEYGVRPKPNEMQTFDHRPYVIFDVREDNGLLEIILKANDS